MNKEEFRDFLISVLPHFYCQKCGKELFLDLHYGCHNCWTGERMVYGGYKCKGFHPFGGHTNLVIQVKPTSIEVLMETPSGYKIIKEFVTEPEKEKN